MTKPVEYHRLKGHAPAVEGIRLFYHCGEAACLMASATGIDYTLADLKRAIGALGVGLDCLVLQGTSPGLIAERSNVIVLHSPDGSHWRSLEFEVIWNTQCPILTPGQIGHILAPRARAIPLPERFEHQGWKLKVRGNEANEEPHVSLLWKTQTWRWGLRQLSFLDRNSPKRHVPPPLAEWLYKHRRVLAGIWDSQYERNPVNADV